MTIHKANIYSLLALFWSLPNPEESIWKNPNCVAQEVEEGCPLIRRSVIQSTVPSVCILNLKLLLMGVLSVCECVYVFSCNDQVGRL